MKISKNILFLLLPLTLLAEEGVNEIQFNSPQTILISTVEYSQEVTFDTQDTNFSSDIIEEIHTTELPTSELTTTFNENSLNIPITQQEKIIEIENKASILTPLSYDEAIAKAQKEHKPILLEVVATDCKYCERMEDEVFTQKKVIDMLKENFILLRMNGTIQTLPLGIGMTSAPMHIFISENGEIKEKYYGYKNEKNFLNILNEQH